MSDQDFFFDDEVVEKPVESKKKAEAPKKQTQPARAKVQAPVEESEGLAFGISVVVLVAIVALLVGVIIGIFVGRSLVPAADFGTPAASEGGMGGMGGLGGGGNAPTLTDEQIQGGMPDGHPPLPQDDGDTPTSNEGASDLPADHPPVDGQETPANPGDAK